MGEELGSGAAFAISLSRKPPSYCVQPPSWPSVPTSQRFRTASLRQKTSSCRPIAGETTRVIDRIRLLAAGYRLSFCWLGKTATCLRMTLPFVWQVFGIHGRFRLWFRTQTKRSNCESCQMLSSHWPEKRVQWTIRGWAFSVPPKTRRKFLQTVASSEHEITSKLD